MKIKKNNGKVIKGLATILMILGILGSVIAGISAAVVAKEGSSLASSLTGQSTYNSYNNNARRRSSQSEGGTGAAVAAFILVAGLGSLMSWVSTRILAGFGELVTYTAESATYLEFLTTQAQPGGVPQIPQAPVMAQVPVIPPVEQPAPIPVPAAQPVSAQDAANAEQVVCPNCGQTVPKVAFCRHCGTDLRNL